MRDSKYIKVGGRKSPLSILQIKEVLSYFPSVVYELITMDSYGDKNKQISLMNKIAPDFFTRELDTLLLNDEADIIIHSAKDLPYPLPQGIKLLALFEAFDKTDSLVSRGNLTLAQLPPGSKVGTSSPTRKAELEKIRPDVTVISIRGTIEERIQQVDEGKIDALIVASCALKRLGLTNRTAEVLPFRTHPLQGNLAVTAKSGRTDLQELFESHDIRKKYGQVTLVGFGPGNPDLLTIAGDKALSDADVIFHDDLLDRDFLNKYPAIKIYVGKRFGNHSYNQDEINELIYEAAISGKSVVRLKGGDPMVFAHGREEIDFLQSRYVTVRVIPGISAAIALSAYTHIPLTHRGIASSVAFVTGHSIDNLQVPDADTLVYYMGGNNYTAITTAAIKKGLPEHTPVALVHNISLPDQKIFYSTLGRLAKEQIKYPTPVVIMIGKVVAFESNIPIPKVLITGSSKDEYTHLGEITHTPLIKIEKNKDNDALISSIENIKNTDWIIFTSRYGVQYFFETFKEMHKDIRTLNHVKIASVGKVTSSVLAGFSITTDFESTTESAEGIIRFFKDQSISNKNILLPRSDKGLKYLSDELTDLGNKVFDVPVYYNTQNEKTTVQDLSVYDKIVFSSPSGVDAFMDIYKEIPPDIEIITKGKTTASALSKSIK